MAPTHALPALHHALSRLSVTKPRIISSPPTQQRRASVALILRIRPHSDDEEYLSQQYDAEGLPLPGSEVDRLMAQSGLGLGGGTGVGGSTNGSVATSQRRSRSRRSSIASSSSRGGAGGNGRTQTQRTLSSFFSLPWVQRGTPEILYIKRATRPTDKWSAHVAFPGGRRDETDEDALYTAMRETWEEVGLDLADRDFLKVGQLDDREITSSLGKRLLMVLSPFVFLQTTPFSHHPELQPTEVASAHWVSLSHLYTPTPKWGTVSIDIANRLAPKSSGIRFLLKGLLGKMDFRCVLLPNDPWAIADEEEDTASEELDGADEAERSQRRRELRMRQSNSQRDGMDLQLWGLTLGMTIDLLAHMSTFPSAPSKSSSSGPISLQSILRTPPSQIPTLFRKIAVRLRDELHLNPPPMADAKAPALTSVYPRFSNTDVNFWIWVFGARYRHIVRSWAASLGGPSERTYNWSGLALGAFYTAVRRALIVAIALRALGALGLAALAAWLGRRRVMRARRGLPGLGLDEIKLLKG